MKWETSINEIKFGTIGVFTNSPQYKDANITNFVLALPVDRNWTNAVCNLEMRTSTTDIYFHIYWYHVLQIKKETANLSQYKVDNNVNIANFVHLWKTRMRHTVEREQWNESFNEHVMIFSK